MEKMLNKSEIKSLVESRAREKIIGSYIDSKLAGIEKEMKSDKRWGRFLKITGGTNILLWGFGYLLQLANPDLNIQSTKEFFSGDLSQVLNMMAEQYGLIFAINGLSLFLIGKSVIKDAFQKALQKKKDLLREVKGL